MVGARYETSLGNGGCRGGPAVPTVIVVSPRDNITDRWRRRDDQRKKCYANSVNNLQTNGYGIK